MVRGKTTHMSDWTVTILGGTIAAVLAGVILYHVLPQSGSTNVAPQVAPLSPAPRAPPMSSPSPTTDGSRLTGLWAGTVSQNNGSSYAVSVNLNEIMGSVDYPSLGCGGVLAAIGNEGDRTVFRENIRYGHGKCIDGGNVTMQMAGSRLSYRWDGRHLGRSDYSQGMLEPK